MQIISEQDVRIIPDITVHSGQGGGEWDGGWVVGDSFEGAVRGETAVFPHQSSIGYGGWSP